MTKALPVGIHIRGVKQVVARDEQAISVQESAPLRVVIPRLQKIELSLYIIIIPPIPDRIELADVNRRRRIHRRRALLRWAALLRRVRDRLHAASLSIAGLRAAVKGLWFVMLTIKR